MATITYTVTVATGTNQYGTGNKFYLNGTVSPDINLIEGIPIYLIKVIPQMVKVAHTLYVFLQQPTAHMLVE